MKFFKKSNSAGSSVKTSNSSTPPTSTATAAASRSSSSSSTSSAFAPASNGIWSSAVDAPHPANLPPAEGCAPPAPPPPRGMEASSSAAGMSNGAGEHDPSSSSVPELAPAPESRGGGDDPVQLQVRLSYRTDIGGMSENQDECFVWKHEASNSVVMGVLDGHGRDVGQLAARFVKRYWTQWLGDHWDEVLKEPAGALRSMFESAHTAMMGAFEAHLKELGWIVKMSNGYLMKKRGTTAPWMCVHGGTSATIVAMVQGRHILTANVGDSAALMGTVGRSLGVSDLVQHSFWEDGGGVLPPCRDPGTIGDPNTPPSEDSVKNGKPLVVVLTADHSPESPREFYRMRKSHPSPCNPHQPHMLVVYDSPPSLSKNCSYLPVFELDAQGVPRVTGQGRYYKNVRHEWASLVTTPPRARFQDALAFTRSIGDFHLQTYGVSHVPDVMTMDLPSIFKRAQPRRGEGQQPSSTPDEMFGCIATCSDGVWDNWDWAEVSDFFLQPQRVALVRETKSSERVTEEFMRENNRRATANFGSQADNATAVICYFFIR